jgi:hypothetical protein
MANEALSPHKKPRCESPPLSWQSGVKASLKDGCPDEIDRSLDL